MLPEDLENAIARLVKRIDELAGESTLQFRWTDTADATLRRMWSGHTNTAIGQALGCCRSAVSCRALALGLGRKERQYARRAA